MAIYAPADIVPCISYIFKSKNFRPKYTLENGSIYTFTKFCNISLIFVQVSAEFLLIIFFFHFHFDFSLYNK